jgi:hypothetical protein
MATLIRAVGATRTYKTIPDALASIPKDMVANGNSFAIELDKDTQYSSVSVSGYTTSDTCRLIFRASPGNSYLDHPLFISNALTYDTSKGVAIDGTNHYTATFNSSTQPYVNVEGLMVINRGQDTFGVSMHDYSVIKNCIVQSAHPGKSVISVRAGSRVINNVAIITSGIASIGIQTVFSDILVLNNTIISPSNSGAIGIDIQYAGSNVAVKNNAIFGCTVPIQRGETQSGDISNNATDKAFEIFTVNGSIQSTSPTSITNMVTANQFVRATDPVDLRLLLSSTLIDKGAAILTTQVSLNSLDRSQTGLGYDIGAWEYATAPKVPGKPIINLAKKTSIPSDNPAVVKLSYSAPASTGGATIDKYRVSVSPADTQGRTSFDVGNVLEATVSVLPGATYAFSVAAHNSVGYSAESDTVSMTIGPQMPVDLIPPTVVTAVAINANTIVLTTNEIISEGVAKPGDFAIAGKTIGEATYSGKEIRLTKIFPIMGETDTIQLAYTKPTVDMLVDESRNFLDSFTGLAVTNSIPPKPSLAGYIVKTFGDDVSDDFSTPAQIRDWLATLDTIALGKPAMVYLNKNLDLANLSFNVGKVTSTLYVTMRPGPGFSFDELEPANTPGQYGTQGVEITVNDGAINHGIVVEACRVLIKYGMGMNWSGGASQGYQMGMRSCRVKSVSTDGYPLVVGYGGTSVPFHDTFFYSDVANPRPFIRNEGQVLLHRNTFVRKGAAAGYPALSNSYGGGASHNNVFSGCSAEPVTKFADNRGLHNYTDVPLVTPEEGMTYVPPPMFVSSVDFRPDAGTAIIGGAAKSIDTIGAISKNDNNGNNRGLNPDSGAFQLVPATPLAVGVITSHEVDGQSVTFIGNTTNAPTSGLVSFIPATPANGAVFAGPFPVTLGTGMFSVTADDLLPGNYTPLITLSNDGGALAIRSVPAIEIIGTSAALFDVANTGPATQLVWDAPGTAYVGEQTPFITIAANGVLSKTYLVTPSDGGAGGTFDPPFVEISPNAPSAHVKYSRPTAGTTTLFLSNDGGLSNPAGEVIDIIVKPALKPPAITINTATDHVLEGNKVVISGDINFNGDPAGTLELYLDPLNGDPVRGPYFPTINNGSWVLLRMTDPGQFNVRLVAKANGLTTTKSSLDFIMRALRGKPLLPRV